MKTLATKLIYRLAYSLATGIFFLAFATPSFANQPESCAEALTQLNGKIVSANKLRLDSKDGRIELPGNNYYEEVEEFAEVIAYVLSRNPKDQADFNKQLRDELTRREMSFGVKNKKSGKYEGDLFTPEVHGMPLTIPQQYFNELVQSTAPIKRAIRKISQGIFSEQDLTPKALGIEAMPEREQEIVIGIIKNSIYYEKALVHPNMKDYPFFSVVGFDAALGSLKKVMGKFFEFNSGTPSGLSNNIQLLEILRKTQPDLFEKMRPYLKVDETFSNLRKTIESNALQWTGNKEGISVVIGPGVFNGAHPDVATIAHFANMPLVKASDLYQDAAGKIRLNTGKKDGDPVVSGIYGRVEESFFLQDSKKGIHWKSPGLEDNPELGKKWGVELEAGVEYQFKKDKNGKRIGVFTDENGKPLPAESWDKIGVDPSRPDAPRGSFADAIVNKQLFFSGVGGRVVDDKRLFEYVSKYLAPMFASDNQVIAAPPRTLRAADLSKLSPERRAKVVAVQEKWVTEFQQWKKEYEAFGAGKGPDPGVAPRLEIDELEGDEYNEFFSASELYVVKAPDDSGGAGIYIMPILDEAKRKEVVDIVLKDVKDKEYRYSIQEFADSGLLPSAEQNAAGDWQFGSLANDLRLFTFMDGEGNVTAGSQSFLLRVANKGSGSTNTSQGAGYGIATVLDSNIPRGQGLAKGESVLPLPKAGDPKKPLPFSQVGEISQFTWNLQIILDRVALRQATQLRKDTVIEQLITSHRSLIDVIGTEHSHFITTMRQFQEGKIKAKEFYDEMEKLKRIVQTQATSYEGATDQFRAGFNLAQSINRPRGPTIGEPATIDEVRDLVDRTQLSRPKRVRTENSAGALLDTYEIGVVNGSKEKFVQDIVDEMAAAGGEVRILKQKFRWDRRWSSSSVFGQFRVDGNGNPIIGIDFTKSHSLAGLAHEFQHFKQWQKLMKEQMEIDPSLSRKAASLKAYKLMSEPEFRFFAESDSLAAEMRVESTVVSELNKGIDLPPQRPSDYGYIQRMSYPYTTAIREHLLQLNEARSAKPPMNPDVQQFFDQKTRQWIVGLISNAEEMRAKALQEIEEEFSKNIADSTRDALLRKKRHYEESILQPMIMNQYEVGQFMELDVWDDFMRVFNEINDEIGNPSRQIQSVPEKSKKPKQDWGVWRNTSASNPLR